MYGSGLAYHHQTKCPVLSKDFDALVQRSVTQELGAVGEPSAGLIDLSAMLSQQGLRS